MSYAIGACAHTCTNANSSANIQKSAKSGTSLLAAIAPVLDTAANRCSRQLQLGRSSFLLNAGPGNPLRPRDRSLLLIPILGCLLGLVGRNLLFFNGLSWQRHVQAFLSLNTFVERRLPKCIVAKPITETCLEHCNQLWRMHIPTH